MQSASQSLGEAPGREADLPYDAGQVLAAALAVEGFSLERWTLHAIHRRPGAGVTAGYDVVCARAGATSREYVLITTVPLPDAARARTGTVTLTDGRVELDVWRHPHDPELPELTRACTPDLLADYLQDVGLAAPGCDPQLELVTYRPLRRAVIRVELAETGQSHYLKILLPRRVFETVRRHMLLDLGGVPVPRVRAYTPQGLVVLEEVRGTPMTDLLAADGGRGIDPREFGRVLDRFPSDLMALPTRPSWALLTERHVEAAAELLPEVAGRLAVAGRTVTHLLSRTDAGPLIPTHGDFYEAQLLFDRGRICGVLDVDTAGPGHRVDDLACLMGHLGVLPAFDPAAYSQVPWVTTRWLSVFDAQVDPVALRARTAAVVLSLVASAYDPTSRGWRAEALSRLEVAERWLESVRTTSLPDLAALAPQPAWAGAGWPA